VQPPSLTRALADRLRAPQPYPSGRFTGRGVVTCAGGSRYFTCAWVLIWVLRRVLHSSLPIQVWHAGRGEMSEGMQLILEEEGVEVVDADLVVAQRPGRVCGGWPLKPYAIAQSRFREVLFLDADAVPLVDPEVAFGWEAYRRDGLLLWPDVLDITRENPVWNALGLEAADTVSAESSVLAVDKAGAWDVLDVAVLLNEHWEELYELIYGDKDSYLLAARLLKRPVSLVQSRPFQLGDDLVQRDQRGEPFVHHRTGSKWNLSGANQPVADPGIDAACRAALAELRRRWTGAVFHAPVRSAMALAAEHDLREIGRFEYSASGRTRPLELLSGGRIGEGRGVYEQHWAVVGEGELALQLFSDVRLTVELRPDLDGTWRGGSVCGDPFDARLVAASQVVTWPPEPRASSAEEHVAPILAPGLFASGFDPAIAREIRETLTLLNRVFDDVPEAVARWLQAHTPAEPWHREIEAMLAPLSGARKMRLERTYQNAESSALDPAHYRRNL
jgi:Mannosyltransferase putative